VPVWGQIGGGREEVTATDLYWTAPQGGGCGPSGSYTPRPTREEVGGRGACQNCRGRRCSVPI